MINIFIYLESPVFNRNSRGRDQTPRSALLGICNVNILARLFKLTTSLVNVSLKFKMLICDFM